MSLLNSYGAANRVVTHPLDTSWEANIVDKLMHIGSGAYQWHRWNEYTRTRTKNYKYIGMTFSAATQCAAAMHSLYNRKILPQIWTNNGLSGSWVRKSQPVFNDYTYRNCADIEITHEHGDSYAVEIDVKESLVLKYTASIISPPVDFDTTSPDRFRAFELSPSSSEYDVNFNGVGVLDYEE